MTYEEAKQAADTFNATNPVGTKMQWVNGHGERFTAVVDGFAAPVPTTSFEQDSAYDVRVRTNSGLPMWIKITALLPLEAGSLDDLAKYAPDDMVCDIFTVGYLRQALACASLLPAPGAEVVSDMALSHLRLWEKVEQLQEEIKRLTEK